MQTFTLKIELGNSEMQTGEDVAEALIGVADRLRYDVKNGTIRDMNGNAVGSFSFEGDPDPDDNECPHGYPWGGHCGNDECDKRPCINDCDEDDQCDCPKVKG